MRWTTTALIVCFATSCFAGYPDERLYNMSLAAYPTGVLTHTYLDFGLSRDEVLQMTRENRQFQHRVLTSEEAWEIVRLRRQGIEPPRQKVTDEHGNYKWPKAFEHLYKSLSTDQRQRHREYTFQMLLGQGGIGELLLFLGKECDFAEVREATAKLRKNYDRLVQRDIYKIQLHELSKLGGDEILELAGEPFEFKRASLTSRIPIPNDEPSPQPILIISSPYVQKELSCTIGQVKKINEAIDILKTLFGFEMSMDEFDPDPLNLHTFDTKEEIKEAETLIRSRFIRILKPKQQKRFRELLIQRYVLVGDLDRALALAMPRAKSKYRRSTNSNDIWAVQHFRGIQVFSPYAKKYVPEKEFAALMRRQMIPHSASGVRPPLEAPLFDEFIERKKKPKNPRR